jgi:hypothetical protein
MALARTVRTAVTFAAIGDGGLSGALDRIPGDVDALRRAAISALLHDAAYAEPQVASFSLAGRLRSIASAGNMTAL